MNVIRAQGMDDPRWMAKMQSKIDAKFAKVNEVPPEQAIDLITARMRELFGESVSRSLVATQVASVYAGTAEGDRA